jgi:hypothetical protein
MRRFVQNVNVINRECCILDALAPSEGLADQWFEYFVGFASERHLHYPYIDPDEDLAGQWLHDSMRDLIQRVLEGDPSVDEDVRKGLEKDIEEFEKANGLDQTATAEARASNIVEKGAIFFGEAKKWLTAVGKGLAVALQGTRLFQLAEASFEQVTKAIGDSLPGIKKLKPLATIGMVCRGLLLCDCTGDGRADRSSLGCILCISTCVESLWADHGLE